MSAPAGDAPTTIGAALAAARTRLAAAGNPSPGLDARMLLGEILGLDTTALVTRPEAPVDAGGAARFEAFVARRLDGEPVARILGRREFRGLRLAVDGSTLVPRPDTEILVDAVLDLLAGLSLPDPLTICDIGTGSGAILIALLTDVKTATGIGIDLAPGAVALAERNARECGIADRSRFALADFATYGSAPGEGPFSLVVSNPPYVASGDIATLQRDVRDWDPRLALDGGADGLDAYRIIAGRAQCLLRPGGLLALEVGFGQADAVAGLLAGAGLTHRNTVNDLSGTPRVVIAYAKAGRSGVQTKKSLGIARRSG